ncbi:MAG: sensor histidine kinase [Nitriliruptor sp.]|nr:MAG: sensor histidine kinase [Nitriliruptor sp.]
MTPDTTASDSAPSDAGVVRRAIDRMTVGDGTFDRPPPSDILLAVVLSLPAVVSYALEGGGPAEGSAPWVGWPLLALIFVPLAWRRVTPSLTISVTGLSTAAWFLLGTTDPSGASAVVPTAVMVAMYSVAAYGSRFDGVVSMLITQFFVAVSILSVMSSDDVSVYNLVVNVLLFLGIWALGDRTRVRRDLVEQLTARAQQAEESRELASDLAVADERTRIARELHDVIAHTVSVVVVQAGAGRRVAANDPAGAEAALASIESIGREALSDLRRMVGVLRDEVPGGDLTPQPTLADVPDLVDRLAAAGLPVTLRFDGEQRALPPGIEVTAYRIVQEALTNVLRHAGVVRAVEVTVGHTGDAVTVTVVDDGRGPATDGGVPGSGLVGMRERVGLYDGALEVGGRPGGGYRVRATLPVPTASADERAGVPAGEVGP